jgi:ketosteroid isomerase-like protein
VTDSAPGELARAFIEAMNAYDGDALAALLTEDAELQGFKGTYIGPDAARSWLGTAGPNLRSTIVVTGVREAGDRALVTAEREWQWVESGEHADRESWHAVFWTRDGRVAKWRPFHFLPEAVEAFESDDLDTGS